ncbi:hypothetical protein RhiirC2_796069 [Rhizophagus irregularis]|uniref:Uncharacterized protein n=1 Tax=Rhizophagus irregularis TaxID=588596 RepID=A0A2N1MAE8_9GLOM|nr:hypothetical protein RhiirC2_796069 [Rhizophagus irregularis]
MGKSQLEIQYTYFQQLGKLPYTGANVLYSQYRGNSHVLLDISSLEKNDNKLLVITNNKSLQEKYNSRFLRTTFKETC